MYMRLITIITTLLLLTGCLTEASHQPQADKIITQLHQHIINHEWQQANTLFSAKFFEEESQQAWQARIETLESKLGAIQSFKITSTQKDPRYGADFYIYMILLQHEHGYSREIVTITEPLDDKPMKITGYKVTARKNG